MARPEELRLRRSPRQSRARMTVDALLEATGRILKESGLERLTCNAVAERAGVSIGSLYQYFPNKEALVAQLRQRHFVEVGTAIAEAAGRAPEASFQARLRAAVAANVRVHAADPELHFLLTERYRDVGHDFTALEPRYDPALRATGAAAGSLMAEYGVDQETARTCLAVVFTIVDALTHAALIHDTLALREEELVDEIVLAATGYLEKRAAPRVEAAARPGRPASRGRARRNAPGGHRTA